MPTMANITVKNAANADVAFLARSPAAGDGSFAQWSTAGATPLQSSVFRVKTVLNGKRDGRRVEITGELPYVSEGTIVAKQSFAFSTTLPLNVPSTTTVDNAAIIGNLMNSALVKEITANGYNAL